MTRLKKNLVVLPVPRFEERPPVKIQGPYNKILLGGQVNNMPHMTRPDMAMTTFEIIEKYASGSVPAAIGMDPYYDGFEDEVTRMQISDDYLAGRNWNTLDLSEQHEVLSRARGEYSRILKGIADTRKAEAEAKRKEDEQLKADIAAWKQQREKDLAKLKEEAEK